MTLWNRAKYFPSQNCDNRPDDEPINLLVIHNISLPPGEFGGPHVKDFFLNQLDFSLHPYFQQLVNLRVSAHCFIDRQGQVAQFVPFHQRAWHAGVSQHQGRSNCNDFSIGIELEGTDDQPYTDNQYSVLVELTQYLFEKYPRITPDNIVGHSDIASGRKTDPGPAFDWQRYKTALVGY